jgi:hypothetical protein
MRRTYSKPMIQCEGFAMDIEIMNEAERARLEAYRLDFIDIYGREPNSEDEFTAFLQQYATADDATSGWCYTTVATPS